MPPSPTPTPSGLLSAFSTVVEAVGCGSGWAARLVEALVAEGLAGSAAVLREPVGPGESSHSAWAGPHGAVLVSAPADAPPEGTLEARYAGGLVRLETARPRDEGPALARAVAAVAAAQHGSECDAAKAARQRTLEVAASEERFRMLAEHASDVISRHGLDGRFTYVSPAIKVILGYEPEDLLGKLPRDFTHPDDREAVISARPELLAEADRTVVRQFRMLHADGGYRRVEAASRWFAASSRDIVVVFRDVTRRVDAEREADALRKADAAASRRSSVAELATLLAHDLNQPLAALTNYAATVARLAGREGASPERIHEAAARVHEEALRAQHMVERVREYVRHRTPRRDPVSFRGLIREACEVVTPTAEASAVRLEQRLDLARGDIRGDAVLLRQVLVNLLLNALHAASAGQEQRVTVTLEDTDEGIRVTVADTGPRLSDEERSHFFEPFHSTRPDGVGLGLVLSRSIVRSHGGCLGVEVPDAGDGLTMVVELPAGAPRRAGPASRAPQAPRVPRPPDQRGSSEAGGRGEVFPLPSAGCVAGFQHGMRLPSSGDGRDSRET